MAKLRESGGDPATLFELLQCWSDARHAYEAAGWWAEAARCFREEYGEARALEAPQVADLPVRAERVDELLQLYLESLEREPGNPTLLGRLRSLVRDK